MLRQKDAFPAALCKRTHVASQQGHSKGPKRGSQIP